MYVYHVLYALYAFPFTLTTGITYTPKSFHFLSPVILYEVVEALNSFFAQWPLSEYPESLLTYIMYFVAFATFGHLTLAEVWLEAVILIEACGITVLIADHLLTQVALSFFMYALILALNPLFFISLLLDADAIEIFLLDVLAVVIFFFPFRIRDYFY